MSLKAQYAAALGNIVIGAHNWWVPLGGVDATGQPSVVGITTAAKATGTLAADGGPTQPTDGDTFVLGSTTYRFKSTLAAAYDIKIGASVAATFDNIKAAVNQSGTAGTEYFAGTLANPTAEATTNGDTSQVFRARNSGALGNLLAFSESITPAWTVTAATLTGGTDAALKVDDKAAAGAVVETGTTAITGSFCALQCIADTVIASYTSNLTGDTLAGVTLTSGTIIFGRFTAFTLTSGKVIAYNAG